MTSSVEAQPVLVDTQAAAIAVSVAPVTVRSWAHRGYLERKGTGKGNRALWDLGAVYSVAAALARGEVPPAAGCLDRSCCGTGACEICDSCTRGHCTNEPHFEGCECPE